MRAFDFEHRAGGRARAVLMNVATVFPFWPGNVGLVQARSRLPLAASYGVAYARGVAFGLGLQAIEMSVGIGVGLIFLAREGLSYAILRNMPNASEADEPDRSDDAAEDERLERAGVS